MIACELRAKVKRVREREAEKLSSYSLGRKKEKWMNDLRLLARFMPPIPLKRSSPLGPGDSPVPICVHTLACP